MIQDILEFYPALLMVWGGLMLGLMSPGPSFIMVANIAVTSRREAVFTAIGCGCGTGVWACLTSFGMTALLILYPNLLQIIQLIGGLYLLYLAIGALKKAIKPNAANLQNIEVIKLKSDLAAWIKGILIHLTNPKAAFVWLSLTHAAKHKKQRSIPMTILVRFTWGE